MSIDFKGSWSGSKVWVWSPKWHPQMSPQLCCLAVFLMCSDRTEFVTTLISSVTQNYYRRGWCAPYLLFPHHQTVQLQACGWSWFCTNGIKVIAGNQWGSTGGTWRHNLTCRIFGDDDDVQDGKNQVWLSELGQCRGGGGGTRSMSFRAKWTHLPQKWRGTEYGTHNVILRVAF